LTSLLCSCLLRLGDLIIISEHPCDYILRIWWIYTRSNEGGDDITRLKSLVPDFRQVVQKRGYIIGGSTTPQCSLYSLIIVVLLRLEKAYIAWLHKMCYMRKELVWDNIISPAF
jgi:hypothetical protein